MRLGSVLALKASLLADLEPMHVKIAKRHLVEVGYERGEEAFPSPSVAFGIASGTGSGPSRYALAIRLFDRRPETRQAAFLAMVRARGESQPQYVGPLRAPRHAPRARYRSRARPIVPGQSVAHHLVTAGTIGAFVERPDGYVYILSNNHVIANTNRARLNDDVLQPGPLDGGVQPRDVVGWFRAARRLVAGSNEIDAALAVMSAEVDYEALYNGRPITHFRSRVDVGDRVCKIGRTTGTTYGRVTAFGLDKVDVDYSDAGDGSLVYRFNDQIEIQGVGQPFSDGGDSGSLIFDPGFHGVGLLFAGNDSGITYANPIHKALAAFGAKLT